MDTDNQIIFGQVNSLSTFIVVEPVMHVEISVRQGGHPASFKKNGHGVIPVVIFGGADVDAAQIDPASLRLPHLTVKIRRNGKPQSCLEDVDRDGHVDLVCHFISNSPWWRQGVMTAALTGNLFDGTLIEGSDEIRVLPCHGGWQICGRHHR